MKKKSVQLKHILFLFFLSLSFLGYAQQNKRDVLYLKNGSIIKGTILEMIPGQTIKIETADGSIFIYKLEEIEKTSIEEIPQKERMGGRRKRFRNEKTDKIEKFWPTGYFVMAKFGPSIESDPFTPNFSFEFINGLQINEYLSLGLGAEIANFTFDDHPYDNNYDKGSGSGPFFLDQSRHSTVPIIPLFFDTRFYIPLQRVHPMFSLQVGYSVLGDRVEDHNYHYAGFIPTSGGTFMALTAGMRVFINSRFSFVTDGGLIFQNLKGYSSSYNGVQADYQIRNLTFMKANVGLIVSFGKNKKSE